MYWPKNFDPILKLYWNRQWPQSKVFYNFRKKGNENVLSSLYTSPEGWNAIQTWATKFVVKDSKGELDEDKTVNAICRAITSRIRYVYDDGEFWDDVYNIFLIKQGDCDDVSRLIKIACLTVGIPDWRLKCSWVSVYFDSGQYAGEHLNNLYLRRADNTWEFKEGTWTPNRGYGRINFTFTRETAFAQHDLVVKRQDLKKREQILDDLLRTERRKR